MDLNYIRGDVGEVITSEALRKLGLKTYRNCYIKGCEIDIIAVSSRGIFVVENKNWSGIVRYQNGIWSVGDTEVPDPVLQNTKHVNAVKEVLGNPEGVRNVVIFNEKAKLEILGYPDIVFSLPTFLREYASFSEVVKRESEVCEKISSFSDISLEARLEHIRRLL